MQYVNNVIATKDEVLTSGFRVPSRPDHNGVDFVDEKRMCNTKNGVGIVAIADGVVGDSSIGGVIKGAIVGNTVAIQHEGKILSRYQHLRDGILVKNGQKVKKGDIIGIMGNTGECWSTSLSIPKEFLGTHLHFSIKENSTSYNNGTWVNPIDYLTGKKTIKSILNISTQSPIVSQSIQIPFISFKEKDKVKIKETAIRWATGEFMPSASWFRNGIYEVLEIGREKLRIGINGVTTGWAWETDIFKI